MIRRNTAGQVIYFPQLTLAADGAAVTAAATLTVSKDGAEAAAAGALVHTTDGIWKYTPTQGETDAAIVALVLTAAAATPVVLNLVTTAADTATVAFGALLAGTYVDHTAAIADLSTRIDSIEIATNAGATASKIADAGVVTTGTNTEGTYASTGSDDDVLWVTAPVGTAVDGFGLLQSLRFDLELGRVPTQLELRGYWSGGGGAVADIYALNARTGVYDKLTNSATSLTNRNSKTLYALTIPRDYADDSNGVNNIVNLQFRSTSTNTTHRLRIDQAIVYHIDEATRFTSTAASPEEIWSFVSRTLTSPGEEPTVVPTTADIYDYFTALARADAFKADVDLQPVLTAIGDVPTVGEFEARTLPSADYATETAAAVVNEIRANSGGEAN